VSLPCTDPNGDAVTPVIVTGPTAGSLGSVDAAASRVIYSPFNNFAGADVLSWRGEALGQSSAVVSSTLQVAAAVPPSAVTPPAGVVDPPALPPRAATKLTPGISWFFKAKRRFTTVRTLAVTEVAARASVRVRCKGKGCRFKTRTAKVTAGRASLARLFRGARLRPGAIIEVSVTHPALIGKLIRFKVRKGRVPTVAVLCLPVGSTVPTVCG
jgi:hypothetical protein